MLLRFICVTVALLMTLDWILFTLFSFLHVGFGADKFLELSAKQNRITDASTEMYIHRGFK